MATTVYEDIESAAQSAADLRVMLGSIWSKLDKLGLRSEGDEWRSVWRDSQKMIDRLDQLPAIVMEADKRIVESDISSITKAQT